MKSFQIITSPDEFGNATNNGHTYIFLLLVNTLRISGAHCMLVMDGIARLQKPSQGFKCRQLVLLTQSSAVGILVRARSSPLSRRIAGAPKHPLLKTEPTSVQSPQVLE